MVFLFVAVSMPDLRNNKLLFFSNVKFIQETYSVILPKLFLGKCLVISRLELRKSLVMETYLMTKPQRNWSWM